MTQHDITPSPLRRGGEGRAFAAPEYCVFEHCFAGTWYKGVDPIKVRLHPRRRGEVALISQLKSPHPDPLPVWRGEGNKNK